MGGGLKTPADKPVNHGTEEDCVEKQTHEETAAAQDIEDAEEDDRLSGTLEVSAKRRVNDMDSRNVVD